jgi:hypothetical protein
VGEDVVLVHQREVAARARRCPAVRLAHDPLDPERGVDADLGGDLVRRPGPDRATVAHVGPLRALPHHDEVDLATGDDALSQR